MPNSRSACILSRRPGRPPGNLTSYSPPYYPGGGEPPPREANSARQAAHGKRDRPDPPSRTAGGREPGNTGPRPGTRTKTHERKTEPDKKRERPPDTRTPEKTKPATKHHQTPRPTRQQTKRNGPPAATRVGPTAAVKGEVLRALCTLDSRGIMRGHAAAGMGKEQRRAELLGRRVGMWGLRMGGAVPARGVRLNIGWEVPSRQGACPVNIEGTSRPGKGRAFEYRRGGAVPARGVRLNIEGEVPSRQGACV